MKICERCGMEYEPTGKNQKYCSSCKNAAKKEQACLHKKEMNEKKRRRGKKARYGIRGLCCMDASIKTQKMWTKGSILDKI